MKEKWKPIVGYEGLYEVSNMGNVRSLTRVVDFRDRAGNMNQRVIKGRVMKPQKQRTGYLHVGLSKDGKVTLFRVHRLGAVAFIDNPEGLYEVNHIDEDKTNNRVDNLEWCDHKYNNNYGSKPRRGERNPMAKLTSEDVDEIRYRRASGEMLKTIAADFGISINHVCNLAQGKRWGHEVSACR